MEGCAAPAEAWPGDQSQWRVGSCTRASGRNRSQANLRIMIPEPVFVCQIALFGR